MQFQLSIIETDILISIYIIVTVSKNKQHWQLISYKEASFMDQNPIDSIQLFDNLLE